MVHGCAMNVHEERTDQTFFGDSSMQWMWTKPKFANFKVSKMQWMMNGTGHVNDDEWLCMLFCDSCETKINEQLRREQEDEREQQNIRRE